MTAIRERQTAHVDFESFSKCFIENKKVHTKDYYSTLNKKNTRNWYENTVLPTDYNSIINRLDEIEVLIKTKVAHKTDIYKSKDEIILEQKNQIEEIKKYIGKLLSILDKKSTPRLFSIISFGGLLISASFLLFTIIMGELILTKHHFIFSTIGFTSMFVMARLSSKIHYRGNS